MSSSAPLTEPTDPRWDVDVEQKQLRPWTESDGRLAARGGKRPYSQVPFLAAPEGFDSQVDSEAPYHGFVSGIGGGKTTAGIIRTAANMEAWNPGELGMIVGPTTPHLKNTILPEMRKWGFLDHWDYNGKGSDQPGLVAPNGSRAILESADNDRKIQRLRGPSISWFWIDEAAHLPRKVWDILIGRLRTGNYRNGYITTTPAGYNWVYERFYGGGDGPPEDVNLTYGVPSTANPHLPADYENLTAEYEGHFREQEVRGLFVQPEGLVYPMFGTDAIVTEPPQNPGRVYYGVDWGFSSPSAILAVVETRTGETVVVEEFYERRCTDDDLAEVALSMQGRWGPGTFYCDPAEPDSIETFMRAGLDAVEAENDVTPGVMTVTNTFPDLYVRESCQNLINELNQYHYPEGDDEKDRPVEKNDHACDALRYALHTAEQIGSHNTGVVTGDFYE